MLCYSPEMSSEKLATDLGRELQKSVYVGYRFLDHCRSRHCIVLGWLAFLECGGDGRSPHGTRHPPEGPPEINRYLVVAGGRWHPADGISAIFAVFTPPDLSSHHARTTIESTTIQQMVYERHVIATTEVL